ncbi:putative coiled coil protein [Candidatus Ichthyocystis hellenicum]|uniref:Putative coiled coil protein n=1 Tax=Candidatus Ichthyocystis hellenicum TaxID=1561003 RepID=A0A0S4M2F2_9BURK|nr:hypothetical protein [Candidatus Ichthyocystis hellenicum]CUT17945.1 putative coiled coil protein [Candidatus Ichthyocystis hellenicum]
MRNICDKNLYEELDEEEKNAYFQSEQPSCSSTDISKLMCPGSTLEFMQIDCSFVDVDGRTIHNLLSGIRSRNLSQYGSAMHVFLESCMEKSLQYLRLFKVEPLTSIEKIDFDPRPDRDDYIIHKNGEYGPLEYMCDYFKYYMLGNCTEVVCPINELINNCIEERDYAKKANIIKEKTNDNKCFKFVAEYGPTTNVPAIGTDRRILYSRNGYSLRLLLEELTQSNSNNDTQKFTDRYLVSKFMVAKSEKKPTDGSILKKIKKSGNTYVAANNWYARSFTKYQLFLHDKFKKTNSDKESIINSTTEIDVIIKSKEELRKNDLKTRDVLIRRFAKYYLSLKNKLEFICKSIFKDESDLLTKEFELPVPEECSLLAAKIASYNHRYKIDADMEVVKNRMSSHLSNHKYKEIGGFSTEEKTIIIRNFRKGYIIKIEDMDYVPITETISISDNIDEDILVEDISTSRTSLRPVNLISGIKISSGTTLVDPELVDPGSIADIIISLDRKDISGYLSAVNAFTAKFMYKSLQYVRALNLASPDYNAIYQTNPDTDEHIICGNGMYGHLQYISDYFKYYVLGSHLESLAHGEVDLEEEILPLLNAVNTYENKEKPEMISSIIESCTKKTELPIGESELLIGSVRIECMNLMENRKELIADINENRNKIKSLFMPLDCSVRNELIRCLMEYYISIMDEFESMANLKFKNTNRSLTERLVLPVPRAVAEIVHEEIETQQQPGTQRSPSYYYVRKRENFFCDINACLCTNSMVYDTSLAIRIRIMEKVIERMKEYLLSLNIGDNGEVELNSVRLFE